MPLLHVSCFSESLKINVSFQVILPAPRQVEGAPRFTYDRAPYPTLFLLHGLSDDHTAWTRNTSIERYVSALQLAVVMPAVNRSFYTDMAHGPRYWTFATEELPAIARRMFPLSDARDDTFVAGLSMGGYGAFKMALRHPERFAAAASLSGAVDMGSRELGADPEWLRELAWMFGDPARIAGSDNDLFHLARRLVDSGVPRPRLYQCCGTEDFLYEGNVKFRDAARAMGLDLTYEEGPGIHEWAYWDRHIQKVLAWLPLRKRG